MTDSEGGHSLLTAGAQVTSDNSPIALLRDKVEHLVEELAGQFDALSGRIVQLSVVVDELDALKWLNAQDVALRLFWESRDKNFWTAGIGVADRLVGEHGESLETLKRSTEEKLGSASSSVRYYGGIRFDAEYPMEMEQSAFDQFSFVLPRFELQQNDGTFSFCCNLVLPNDLSRVDQIFEALQEVNFHVAPLHDTFPLPVSRHDWPVETDWRNIVEDALSMIRNGHALEKVVLARKAVFAFAASFDKLLLFKLLRDSTPHCFHFFFQIGEDTAFLGAPPERLYRRSGRRIESEAVAGTGRRGEQNGQDIELGKALLLSDKDQREHAFVRDSIEDVFSTLCSATEADPKPSLMNLSIGRHLRSKFQGLLQAAVSDIDILDHLPPTAAVGGHPRHLAIRIIRELESFDRGWYAGPVGWFSNDAAEFAVAIRSGLASGESLSLFSGAGIVDGSEPATEWAEIEQKIGDFIKALGLDQKGAKY